MRISKIPAALKSMFTPSEKADGGKPSLIAQEKLKVSKTTVKLLQKEIKIKAFDNLKILYNSTIKKMTHEEQLETAIQKNNPSMVLARAGAPLVTPI